jgi:acyl-CoA synthetase (AMP-forming)/AMP-acid ligase II
VDFPDFHAEHTRDRPAYVLGDAVFTYRGLVDVSIGCANLLCGDRFVDARPLLAELPRTPTGKLLRRVVQEQYPTLVAVD